MRLEREVLGGGARAASPPGRCPIGGEPELESIDAVLDDPDETAAPLSPSELCSWSRDEPQALSARLDVLSAAVPPLTELPD
ncbi:MAG: hypothetical protein LC808_15015 [Actinobacteria bacterium]|nr:hypothetical protein [Actinomycetota bacterium]